MAIAFVISHSEGTSRDGGTTSAIDTTGCDLLVVVVSSGDFATAPTLTDSKGNTWNARTEQVSGGEVRTQTFYATNPTVGSGHTFSLSDTNSYPSLAILGFSGANTSSPYDTETGSGGGSGTTRTPGSITPSVDGCVIVSGLGGTGSHGSPHSITVFAAGVVETVDATGTYFGCFASYEIQTTATARNPVWSWPSSAGSAGTNTSFKPAGGGATNAALLINGGLVNRGLVDSGLIGVCE